MFSAHTHTRLEEEGEEMADLNTRPQHQPEDPAHHHGLPFVPTSPCTPSPHFAPHDARNRARDAQHLSADKEVLATMEDVVCHLAEAPKTIQGEVVQLLKVSSPIMFSLFLSHALTMVSLVCIGRIGDPHLMAAAGLAQMSINVTGWSIVLGLLCAQETLSSQAFGAMNYRRMGILWLRSMIICLLVLIPVAFVWWFIDRLLPYVGQEIENADVAARYTRPMILVMPAYVVLETTRRFLQSQQITRPIAITSLCGAILHVIMCPLFVFWFGWGFDGAVYSMVITFYVLAISLVIAARMSNAYTMGAWPQACDFKYVFHSWREFIFLGLPGIGMVAFEWIAYETGAFMSGLLGTNPMAAHNIVVGLVGMSCMWAWGMACAATARIGSFLGSGQPHAAKRCAQVLMGLELSIALVVAAVTALLRNQIARLWTSNPEVAAYAEMPLLLGSLYIIFDSTQVGAQGVLRGSGLQAWGTPVILVGSYGLALPLGATFAFKLGWGLRGLWMGLCLGYLCVSATFSSVLLFIRWEKIATKARERALADMTDLVDLVLSPQMSPMSGEDYGKV